MYQSARPADKPHSVPQTGMLAHGAGGEGHLSCSRVTPRLQQPTRDSRKTSRFPPSEEGFASAWLCSHWGLPGRCITANAGGLLNHHFTLALAGGMFLWPDPAGYPAPGVTRQCALWSTDFPRSE